MRDRETGPLTGPYLCLPHVHFSLGHCEHMKTDSMICLSRSFLPLGPRYAQVRVAFSGRLVLIILARSMEESPGSVRKV